MIVRVYRDLRAASKLREIRRRASSFVLMFELRYGKTYFDEFQMRASAISVRRITLRYGSK